MDARLQDLKATPVSSISISVQDTPDHTRNNVNVGGPDQFFCKDWGCKSTGWMTWQAPVESDLITVTLYGDYNSFGIGHCPGKGDCGPCYKSPKYLGTPEGKCNTLIIKFTDQGKNTDWSTSKSWGLCLYINGYDPGVIFSIQRYIEHPSQIISIGPNLVLAPLSPLLHP